jgi:hypothetical protein
MCCEALEDSFRGHPISNTDALERLSDRGFDRTVTGHVHSRTAFREPQHRASSIGRIVGTSEQSLSDQSLEHTGQRAGMYVQHGRQAARGHAREETDHAQHQPLRARNPDVACHPLRYSFQSMHDRPQELHELQYVWQIGEVLCFINVGTRPWHIILNSN